VSELAGVADSRKQKVDSRSKIQALLIPLKSRFGRSGIALANIGIFAAVGIFVIISSHNSSISALPLDNSSTAAATDPVDQVSAAGIALTVAQINNMPETTAVSNQAQSAAANLAMSTTANNVVSKPEVVTTSLKSKANIFTYTTQSGDTVTSLASKFGINSNSIMWSNGLTLNTLNPGTKITVPPVNGIVYTVKAGDTPQSLASTYKASATDIISYNDAEIGGLTPGEQIIIPGGTLPTASTTGAVSTSTSSNTIPVGDSSFDAVYGYNGYDFGYCTWYVATQVPVPANWGNAATWAYYAAQSGWNVSLTPTVGSVAQTADAAGGEGHVAIVTGVSSDGSQITIREMNGPAGWDRVDTETISATRFQHFITP
jgi:surface antigen